MKKFLSLVLALVMTMSLVTISAGAKDFADDDKITYDEAVAVISEIGVVDGYTDGKFNPTNTLTRQAAAKIICNLILGPTTASELHADTAPYKDVPTTSEFSGYIAYCAKEGIISGYADGTFKPGNTLTGYAFMKMLLGALGYDANYEQYVGSNWSINVAKQAIGIGLNKTLEGEFNGIKAVTREEACLYAFNTLKATMVAYDNKITANVNGAEVTISNTNAKPVTWKEGINEDGNIKKDGFVQFAEEFFPKLVRKDDYTKFMEPANTWVFDKTEIGTFERKDLIVETYTKKVTGKDAYDLLKAGVIKDNDLEVYVDGVDAKGTGTVALNNGFEAIAKFDKDNMVRSNDKALGATGDGVLTKVYLDTDKDLITFVSINTYLAKATADYSESKEYAPLNVYNNRNNSTKSYNVDKVDVENVVDVTKDDFYLVNISWKDSNAGEVAILSVPEILEDSTVTKFSAKNGDDATSSTRYVTKLTTGGTEYKANVKAFYDKDVLDTYNETLLTDNTYNVYLDSNGFFVGVSLFEGTKNYVFITGFDRNSSNLSVKTATACGIFLDGTMQNIQVNVTDTDKNIDKAQTIAENGNYFKKWADTSWQTDRGIDGVYNLNQWFTYTVDANGTYTLKPCARMTKTQFLPDAAHAVAGFGTDTKVDTIRTDALSIVDDLTANNRVYGEDDTVFLTVDLDIVDTTSGVKKAITEVTGVYTGVQNVDIDIDVTDPQAIGQSQVFTVYDSDYYVIGAVVIGEARGSTANYAYIVSGAKSEEKIDDTYYWEFDAVLNGEKQTLKAKSKYHNTIEALRADTIQELRFDGDYVVSIKDVDKVYTDYRFHIDGEDVYAMRDELTTNTQAVNATPAVKGIVDDPDTLFLQGRTLYVTANRVDVGLGLAKDAKAVTIQKENGSWEETNFADVASAIAHLADADEATAGFQYNGKVYAVLNSNGTADWVVFYNDIELKTGAQTGGSTAGSGELYTYNSTVTDWGQAYASLNYNRPTYVPTTARVDYSFDVYADGVWIDHDAGTLTGNAARWNGYTKPSSKIELRNVVFTPYQVVVNYVDQNGKTLTMGKLSDGVTATDTVADTQTAGTLRIGSPVGFGGGTYAVTKVDGATYTGTLPTGIANGSATTVAGVLAAGTKAVTVTVDTSALTAVTYTATNLTAAAVSTLKTGYTGLADAVTFDATFTKNSSLTLGETVGVTIKAVSALATTEASGANVYFAVDGKEIGKVFVPNDGNVSTDTLAATFKVVGNPVITVTKVEAVSGPTITKIEVNDKMGNSFLDANTTGFVDTITVYFSEKVTTAPTLTGKSTLTFNAGTLATDGMSATYTVAASAADETTAYDVEVSGAKSFATGITNNKVVTYTFTGLIWTVK